MLNPCSATRRASLFRLKMAVSRYLGRRNDKASACSIDLHNDALDQGVAMPLKKRENSIRNRGHHLLRRAMLGTLMAVPASISCKSMQAYSADFCIPRFCNS